jgi:hypothetical protein
MGYTVEGIKFRRPPPPAFSCCRLIWFTPLANTASSLPLSESFFSQKRHGPPLPVYEKLRFSLLDHKYDPFLSYYCSYYLVHC